MQPCMQARLQNSWFPFVEICRCAYGSCQVHLLTPRLNTCDGKHRSDTPWWELQRFSSGGYKKNAAVFSPRPANLCTFRHNLSLLNQPGGARNTARLFRRFCQYLGLICGPHKSRSGDSCPVEHLGPNQISVAALRLVNPYL